MKDRKKYLMMEAAKTALWVCGFIAIGYLVVGPLFKGKPQKPSATAAGDDAYLIGKDNPRVKELSQEYTAITFNSLSDFFYYTPEPGEKPDPKLMKKSSIPADCARRAARLLGHWRHHRAARCGGCLEARLSDSFGRPVLDERGERLEQRWY